MLTHLICWGIKELIVGVLTHLIGWGIKWLIVGVLTQWLGNAVAHCLGMLWSIVLGMPWFIFGVLTHWVENVWGMLWLLIGYCDGLLEGRGVPNWFENVVPFDWEIWLGNVAV